MVSLRQQNPWRGAKQERCRDFQSSRKAGIQVAARKSVAMTLNLSLSEILANLKQRIASLREQVESHARQEEHHREQRALLEAELQKSMKHLESFQEVASAAEGLDLPVPAPPPPKDDDLGPNPPLPKMVRRVVADRPEGEKFGPRLVAQEVNRRFRKQMRRAVDAREVSVVLRRMSDAGSIQVVREGKPNHEALYVRGTAPR